VGALVLLLTFVVAIGLNMARGRNPDCHCFGQLHSEPAGWPTLARNGVLAGLAAWLVARGPGGVGPGLVGWFSTLGTTDQLIVAIGAVGLGLIAAEAWFLAQMLGQNGRLLLRLDALESRLALNGQPSPSSSASPAPTPAGPAVGPEIGAPAPAFELLTADGQSLSLQTLLAAGRPILLLFMHPHCAPCNALAPEVTVWQREQTLVTVAIISQGAAEEARAKAQEHGLARVLLDADQAVSQRYRVQGTPVSVPIRPDGVVLGRAALGPNEIRSLYFQLVAGAGFGLPVGANGHDQGAPRPPGPPAATGGATVSAVGIGDPAPALADATDAASDAEDLTYSGRRTVVLFWNSSCGFCQQMLPDLRAWDANPPAGAPRLVVALQGGQEGRPALDLRSPLVLDPDFSLGRRFGANGTPMAVLVDEQGRVASRVAAGAPEVMALLNGTLPTVHDRPAGPSGLAVGAPAPAVELPSMSGETVRLSDFRGSPTLLLFWNPGCGFCQGMLEDLKRWQAAPPPGAPKLLVISMGDVESNRAQGIAAPVLLDGGFQVGPRFGVSGTPSAVLIDAEGRVASPVAVGAPAVLALAGAGQASAAA
jgi:thiol-disulfide isomerase/thioredoxin